MAKQPTMGSALADILRADNDEDREKAAKDMETAQGDLVKEAEKVGCKLTFGVQVPEPPAASTIDHPQPEAGG